MIGTEARYTQTSVLQGILRSTHTGSRRPDLPLNLTPIWHTLLALIAAIILATLYLDQN